MVARIGPKNDVMTLLAPHFADRLPEENWIIYDENREKAAVHPRGKPWILVNHPLEQPDGDSIWQLCLEQETDEREYEDLWISFFTPLQLKKGQTPSAKETICPCVTGPI